MSLLSDTFNYLAAETQRSFASTTSFLWWPATQAEARAGTYSIQITAAAGPAKQDENLVMGALSVPVDALAVHALAADFPTAFPPRPRILCLYGPDNGSGAPDLTLCRKYQVAAASEPAAYLTHYDLTLTRAD